MTIYIGFRLTFKKETVQNCFGATAPKVYLNIPASIFCTSAAEGWRNKEQITVALRNEALKKYFLCLHMLQGLRCLHSKMVIISEIKGWV